MNFKELQLRIIELTKRNISQTDIAKSLNVKPSNISMRAKSNSPLNTAEIEKIEKYFNIKLINSYTFPDELIKTARKIEKYSDYMPADFEDEYTGTTSRMLEETNYFINVPYYPELEASCGNGTIAPFVNPNPEYYPISDRYGLSNKKKYFIINAFGDSMEKTIFDKEYIIFEDWKNKNNQIIDNKIYFFCYEGRLYIKRLIFNIHEVIVISDNSTKDENGDLIYKPQIIKKEDMNNLNIYGKFKGKIEND